MGPNRVVGIANHVDPDQTAPLIWSGSALFAKTCLSENLGSLGYFTFSQEFSFFAYRIEFLQTYSFPKLYWVFKWKY